jgi:hypothetical protein
VLPIPGERDRITVEVINTTDVDGLARDVTRRLRRAGIDVVYVGSGREQAVDSTLILVRRGDPAAGERVRSALDLGRVGISPDPRLLLDVSVLLGPDAASALRRHP